MNSLTSTTRRAARSPGGPERAPKSLTANTRTTTLQFRAEAPDAYRSRLTREVGSPTLVHHPSGLNPSGSSRYLPNQPAGSIMDATAIVLLLELVCLGTSELEVDAMAVLVGGPSRQLPPHTPPSHRRGPLGAGEDPEALWTVSACPCASGRGRSLVLGGGAGRA